MPFQTTFESSVEKHYQTTGRTLYDCVVYWYLAPKFSTPRETDRIRKVKFTSNHGENMKCHNHPPQEILFASLLGLCFFGLADA